MGRSGAQKSKSDRQESNDKPRYDFGLPQVDDNSIRRAILSVAPLYPRHYVIMEVKQNLTASDRKINLKRFNLPHFKKIAAVVMGEPNAEYKSKVHEKLLQDKQRKLDTEHKQKLLAKERKKAEKKKQKELAEKKKAQAELIAKRKEEIKKRRKKKKRTQRTKKKQKMTRRRKENPLKRRRAM